MQDLQKRASVLVAEARVDFNEGRERLAAQKWAIALEKVKNAKSYNYLLQIVNACHDMGLYSEQ